MLLKVADESFLITAGHVAWDGTQGRESLAIAGRKGNVYLSYAKVFHTTPSADRHVDDAIDVAVVKLNAEHEAQLRAPDYVFLRQDGIVSRYEGQAPLGDLVQLYGFPSATEVKDVAANTLGASPRLLAVTLRDGSALPKFDPRLQMSMEYPDLSSDSVVGPDGSRHRPVHPDGMSGGGVWAVLFRNLTPVQHRRRSPDRSSGLVGRRATAGAREPDERAADDHPALLPELKPALELELAHGVEHPHLLTIQQYVVPADGRR